MMNTGALKVTTPTEREIAMTRVFNAPRRFVFEALTKPELLRRWLGGLPGWSMTVCDIDLRVGGSYRWVWNGPNSEVMGIRGVYREVVVPERIVATEKFDQAWYPGEAVGTIVLKEHNGVTTLIQTILYESKEVRDGVLKTPMEHGVSMSYDRLEAMLPDLVKAS